MLCRHFPWFRIRRALINILFCKCWNLTSREWANLNYKIYKIRITNISKYVKWIIHYECVTFNIQINHKKQSCCWCCNSNLIVSSVGNDAHLRRNFSSAENGSIPNPDKFYFNAFQENSTKKDRTTKLHGIFLKYDCTNARYSVNRETFGPFFIFRLFCSHCQRLLCRIATNIKNKRYFFEKLLIIRNALYTYIHKEPLKYVRIIK